MNKAHGITAENLLASLPEVLQADEHMRALAASIAEVLAARPAEIDSLRIYANIEKLPEDLLDILAYDFKVDWWDANNSLEEKRAMLKDSWRVHRTLGTKSATEEAISAISPGTTIKEWFEYDGTPGCFQLQSTDPSITGDKLAAIYRLLDIVKRASAKLEAICINLDMEACTCGIVNKVSACMDIWPLEEEEL